MSTIHPLLCSRVTVGTGRKRKLCMGHAYPLASYIAMYSSPWNPKSATFHCSSPSSMMYSRWNTRKYLLSLMLSSAPSLISPLRSLTHEICCTATKSPSRAFLSVKLGSTITSAKSTLRMFGSTTTCSCSRCLMSLDSFLYVSSWHQCLRNFLSPRIHASRSRGTKCWLTSSFHTSRLKSGSIFQSSLMTRAVSVSCVKESQTSEIR
mmetsp:Transcript_13872/g.40649  ORF Transcript_13872/g.40649 Transcript_13872/m.40649 type:complete len:207 (+) Transcript_13872:217-837(+)